MSKYSKNKIASAIAATLVLASTPTLAENLIPEGTLEELVFENANLAFNVGPMLSDGTTQAWGQIGTGWCRFINDTISGKDADWFRHSPTGNDTNVAYCNHKRTNDNGGIYRAVEGLEAGKTYALSGKGSTRGSLQWAIEYAKVGAEQDEWGNAARTVVDLTNVVESDLAWVTIEDTMTVPEDADLAQPFRVFIHTQPSTAFPSTDVLETERSQLWVDDFELTAIAEPVEYFADGDLEDVTGFVSGNSAWGNGPKLADGTSPAYTVDTGGFKSGWGRFINKERTQSAAAGSEAIPAGNDSEVVAFLNHNRNNDAAGIARIVEGIQPGMTYHLAGDGATSGSIRWGYSYTKIDAETRTRVELTNIVESDRAWVTVTDSFVAPEDIDTSKDFMVFIYTAPSAAFPAEGDISSTDRSLLWTDNYSLMGPPASAGPVDSDGDGVPDDEDAFPDDAAASLDTDGDKMPDEYNEDCDIACQEASNLDIDDDDDGDGIDDVNDGHPLDGGKDVLIGFAADSVALVEGEEFVIDASSSIPNSELATYVWSITGLGNLAEDGGETATYTAPSDLAAQEDVIISLTVTSASDSATETFPITVANAPAQITANATLSGMLNAMLAYGEKIQLDASSSMDSEDGMLSYKWKVTGVPVELSDDTAVNPSFYVPLVKADTPITIEVTVSNYLTDYDGTYLLDDEDNMIVASSETYSINATVKRTFPVIEYPLEYFPEGDMESVTGFETEGWGIGNYSFKGDNAIFTNRVDEDGNKIAMFGQTGKGWSRYINHTRTQAEGGFDVRPPEGRIGVVAHMNDKRQSHAEGLYAQVEGIVPGASYNYSIDAAASGTVQLSYEYVKTTAVADENGNLEKTRMTLGDSAASGYKWVTLAGSLVAPTDIDVSQEFILFVHTIGDASVNLKGTEDARLWMDNVSLQELSLGTDTDNDGVIDINDGFPNNPAIAADTDGDGLPDDYVKTCDQACQDSADVTIDNDDDNDGILDTIDGFPKDSREVIKITTSTGAKKVFEGAEVVMDASSSLPSTSDATYTWTQVSGVPVAFSSTNSAMTMFNAPTDLTEEAFIEVMLTIDYGDTSKSEIYSLSVINAPAVIHPSIELYSMTTTGADTDNPQVETTEIVEAEDLIWEAGQEIKIDALRSVDSEGGDLEFSWKTKGGPLTLNDVEGSSSSKTFIVPEYNIETVITFELTVSNYLRDYNGDYILNDDNEKIVWSTVKTEAQATILKTEQEKPDHGSFGFFAMLLLSGLTCVRRLFKK
ncbi:hypothetical protein [Thalassotalea crassostreae]|uniref:hypothetical protein n=1 Tax=Thalassotalea crassostreae TaxID=1763536 RepID=UPI000838FCAB|nr:hypothetical protein [Thalassotalea crassostreae]